MQIASISRTALASAYRTLIDDRIYMLGLHSALPDSFHYTALLILDVLHPIGLPSGHQHMRAPSIDLPVQLLIFIDLPSSR